MAKTFTIEDLKALHRQFQVWGRTRTTAAAELTGSVNLLEVVPGDLAKMQEFLETSHLEVRLVIKCASPSCPPDPYTKPQDDPDHKGIEVPPPTEAPPPPEDE